jgi:hypothetical protein
MVVLKLGKASYFVFVREAFDGFYNEPCKAIPFISNPLHDSFAINAAGG